jgi:hypothetical protein
MIRNLVTYTIIQGFPTTFIHLEHLTCKYYTVWKVLRLYNYLNGPPLIGLNF